MPGTRTINWDNVNSLVHDYIQPYVVDTIYGSNPTYMTLEQNNRVISRGGDVLTWPVAFAKLNAGTYRGMTPFPSTEVTTKTRAVLEFKQGYVDVVISEYDALRASGPLAVLDLVDEVRQEAYLAASDLMGTQLYGDGQGNAGLDFDGARVAFDDGTNYATYAGLARSGNPWWQGQLDETGGALTTSAMNASYMDATVGNMHPNLITTTTTLWRKLWDRVQPQQRYEAGDEKNRTARVGFDTIRFNGADVVHDSHCPAGNMWYWTVESVEFRVMEGRMWDWTGWKGPTNQDGRQGQLLFMGNFIFNNPRLFARDTGVT